MGGRVGYEYSFSFWMEDEIINLYEVHLHDGMKSFLFEIRTNFVLRKSPDGGGFDEILDSERYYACVKEDRGGCGLHFSVAIRLVEYWMSPDEITKLTREAFDFAKQMAADPQHASRRVIPVVVGLDVCTVQREGEPLDSALDRAIRAQNLIPLYLCSVEMYQKLKPPMPYNSMPVYLRRLPRIRVEDVDQGLALMETCRICSRKPTIGAQITPLPCSHAFHSHCAVKYLEGNRLCPICHSEAHSFAYLSRLRGH